ncbi:phage distal tail protein domain-containing protein [Leuconostoc mesenteroides]|uniref:phage distal tail protein domain-containing protein n=1 Tax=Leuconostoc mesenteroides TaxID=1245 RepID=UPI0020736015|nr:phage distal tail protein domain-containing protein [Leuconostoc mesenteroides]MCM6836075.1 phage baseplate protein [Leuconostoc mesenteroides]
MSMFVLHNARGESVDLNNDSLLSYTPTGLGTTFTNTYSQYESYFKMTKANIQQGQMQLNIMFGDVESRSYQTFSQFATFLSFQPLTLIYNTGADTWHRDARLTSLSKTEIGGSTVLQTDRLVEQFTIEFINPWYNNKQGRYKTYNIDTGLSIYGSGFFNEQGDFNQNLILQSSAENASADSRPNLSGVTNNNVNSTISYESDGITLTYSMNNSWDWYYALAEAWANMSDSVLSFDKTYTISVDVKGTVPSVAFRVNNTFSPTTKINNDTWTRAVYTFSIPNLTGDNLNKFYIRLNAMNGNDNNPTGFVKGQTLRFRHFKLEEGNTATAYTSAPEDGVTDANMKYGFGFMGVAYDDENGNKPYVDEAQVDITSIE